MTDTPARQPHPQRCETCTVEQCGFNYKCEAIVDISITVHRDAVHWFTRIWGCARHSDSTHTNPRHRHNADVMDTRYAPTID